MDDLIRDIEAIPLSAEDGIEMSEKLGNPNVFAMLYDDLKNVKSLDELFEGKAVGTRGSGDHINTVYILLNITNDQGGQVEVGHWMSLIKNQHGFSHFDSYGIDIGKELSLSHEPDLINRLIRGIRVESNRFRYQNFREDVSTCMRHTVVRSIFHFYTNTQYHNFVISPMVRAKEFKDMDTMVACMTGMLIKADQVLLKFFKSKIRDVNIVPFSSAT